MAGIAALSGQEYVDEYASRKKMAPGDGGRGPDGAAEFVTGTKPCRHIPALP